MRTHRPSAAAAKAFRVKKESFRPPDRRWCIRCNAAIEECMGITLGRDVGMCFREETDNIREFCGRCSERPDHYDFLEMLYPNRTKCPNEVKAEHRLEELRKELGNRSEKDPSPRIKTTTDPLPKGAASWKPPIA